MTRTFLRTWSSISLIFILIRPTSTNGIDRMTDRELRDYARRERLIIVTKDSDFSDLCILLGFPPKVIWIRRGNCSTATIERILRDHSEDIEALGKEEIMGILTLF